MAVKAREKVSSREFSLLGMAIIFVFVVGYTLIYNRSISLIDNFELKTSIGIAALIIMIIFFFVVIRFITTSYSMVLTHKNLSIERKIFFFERMMADIPVNEMESIVSEAAFKGVKGKLKNYTLARIEGKGRYVITYKHNGIVNAVKIQCSSKFYNETKKLINK
ncbi:MAG: hypothetical protein RR310_07915 [Eubacterium sp.]